MARERAEAAPKKVDYRDAPRPFVQCWFVGCGEMSVCSIQTTTLRVNTCLQHYAAVDRHAPAPDRNATSMPILGPWRGVTEFGLRTSAEIQTHLKKLGRQRPDRSWADRVMARHLAGAEIELSTLEMARAVSIQPAERTPGEDDE